MMSTPFASMLSWMGPMGPVSAIVLVAVIAAATGMLVLWTQSRRPFDAPHPTG